MTDLSFENWTTQLRKGLLELAILNAITAVPLYGYDIVRRLSDIDDLVITEGTVYPILSRLKNSGLVETYLEESQEGPPRKYYRLTARGRDELSRMNQHWDSLHDAIDGLRKDGSNDGNDSSSTRTVGQLSAARAQRAARNRNRR